MTETTPTAQAIQLFSAKQSDMGRKRSNNEDFTALYEPIDPQELTSSGSLYVVADGVGGSYKGEQASKYAVEKVLYEYYRSSEVPPADRLRQTVRDVGNDLYTYSVDHGLERMASTMVAAVILGDQLLVANVGDSRAYLIRGSQVRQITRDHNQASELLQAGIITKAEAARSTVKNVLTRSLGSFPDVEVDIFDDITLLPGDLLLLCTDGLYRYLNDPALLNLTAGGSPAEITKRMITFARQAGGADNITALMVAVRPAEDSTRAGHPFRLPKRPPALSHEPLKISVPNLVIPRLGIPRLEAFMRLSPRYQLYAVGGIIATLLLAILIFNLLNRNPGASPGTGGEKAPTQNMFVAPTKGNATPAPQKANPIPTWTNVVSPTPTPIPETCVYKVQNGDSLSYIFLNMGIAYQANATYTYYTDCNVVSGTCSKPGNVAPGNHDAIQPGWYFVIDGVEKDTCVAKDGHVIKIKVKP